MRKSDSLSYRAIGTLLCCALLSAAGVSTAHGSEFTFFVNVAFDKLPAQVTHIRVRCSLYNGERKLAASPQVRIALPDTGTIKTYNGVVKLEDDAMPSSGGPKSARYFICFAALESYGANGGLAGGTDNNTESWAKAKEGTNTVNLLCGKIPTGPTRQPLTGQPCTSLHSWIESQSQ